MADQPRTAGRSARLLLTMLVVSCTATGDMPDVGVEPPEAASPAFVEGDEIPATYTCDGDDVPPPLTWDGTHPDAVEVVLIVDDPDAPRRTFTHWLVAGLPLAGEIRDGVLPTGAVEGTNDFGTMGYRGPCPPPGDDAHSYRFQFIGVADATGLAPGFTREQVDEASAGSRLSSAVLSGVYGR